MDYGDKLKTEKELSELTDRQLQERIAYELIDTKKKTESIKNNVQFFFWLTLASIAIAIASTIK
ncbi:hypothetical protein [Flavobacterium sp.]|jgi:hypothetical protein|uniref:hypothetical protein n=1 Tax=Flavobacterium sp. TaxID=239 RepID=UPI0037BF14B4